MEKLWKHNGNIIMETQQEHNEKIMKEKWKQNDNTTITQQQRKR